MNDMQNDLWAARPDCQVLVVGAGPTGLVLAADLLARGITTRVIDKGDGVNLETRAVAIHARALEVLDLMGLAGRFVERGQIVRYFRFYTDGRRRLSLDLTRNGTRFGFMLDIPQHDTESLLRARVAELGGVIEQGTELMGLSDGPAGVTARIRDATGQPHAITASYLAGCGGAHSRVRHELGLPFHGHPYPQDWLLADVRLDWARPEDEVHAFFRADGVPLICFPMRQHTWRLVLPFAGDRAPGAPDLGEIQQLVDQRAPERVTASDPTWLASFNCHRRQHAGRHHRRCRPCAGRPRRRGGRPDRRAHRRRHTPGPGRRGRAHPAVLRRLPAPGLGLVHPGLDAPPRIRVTGPTSHSAPAEPGRLPIGI